MIFKFFVRKLKSTKRKKKKIHRKRHTKTTNTQLLFQNEKLWKKNVNWFYISRKNCIYTHTIPPPPNVEKIAFTRHIMCQHFTKLQTLIKKKWNIITKENWISVLFHCHLVVNGGFLAVVSISFLQATDKSWLWIRKCSNLLSKKNPWTFRSEWSFSLKPANASFSNSFSLETSLELFHWKENPFLVWECDKLMVKLL